jgi:3-oxoacyl-[acyl-carrier protein] reductase
MEAELQGSVVLVTGAARNIGAEIARTCAAAGAAVAINAKSSGAEAEALAAEIRSRGGAAVAILADVTDPADATRLVAQTVAHFGRLDVLVNNAAVRSESPFAELTLERWHAVLRSTLDGTFLCSQASLPHLRASGSGTIVNIGGLTAHTGARHRAHVVTAKAGLVGLTRALAHELGSDGITVNCVVPGLIRTERAGTEPGHRADRVTLVGRFGVPGDVASAVRWLAGPGARYVTGQTVHVNGGLYLG